MAEKPRVLGIDLGTSNTCVAHVRHRVAKIVPLEGGHLTLPSVVALSPRGEMLIGAPARDQLLVNPQQTIVDAERLIGRNFHSRVVQELRERVSYQIVEGPGGEAAVRLGERILTLPEVSGLVLGRVKSLAEQFLEAPVEEVLLSVPAYYNDNQRNAVKEAGRLAGLRVRRIVNEPTAAALAYAAGRNLAQKVLVYDLGGGTFDVSVLQLHESVFEVVASGGDTFLGGSDFDNRIVEHLIETFARDQRVDLRAAPIAMQRVRSAAEAAKRDLSLVTHVTLELPFLAETRGRPLDLRLPLTRETLEQLTADLVDRTFDICDRVLGEKGIDRREIGEVILVGGQSRMPLVQRKIQEHFGKPARKGVHPDECVAQGAALLGDALGALGSLTLIDVLSMPIGIATAGGRFRRILDKHQTIPASRNFRLPPPRPESSEIVIEIFQGESEAAVDNEFLGTLRVDGQLAGRKIDFTLSEECLLSVTVDRPAGAAAVQLATRDTPEGLKAALARDDQRRRQQALSPPPLAGPGLFGSLRRLWGRA